MGFFRKQFRKVIQWENVDSDLIAWKFPLERKEEIMRKSQLVVREGQKAIFVQEGKVADVFSPGTYQLSEIRNIPILTQMYNWKYAWESPFTGDIVYFSTKQFINNKWGTTNYILMKDKDFGMKRIKGFGSFSFSMSNPTFAMSELLGSEDGLRVSQVNEYFKKIITSILSNVIAESECSALELAGHYDDIAKMAKVKLVEAFEPMGVDIKAVFIENLSLSAEAEKTIDKRTSIGVMSDSMSAYAQMESIGAMRDAAKNNGGVAGMGVGMGAGLGIGKMFSDNINSASRPAQQEVDVCPKCGANAKKGSKFCPECGAGLGKITCPKCGSQIKKSAKFCPECGQSLAEKACPKCGIKLKAGAKFCPECGEKL